MVPSVRQDATHRSWRWLPLVLGLAVGLRLGLALLHPVPLEKFPDAQEYDALARAIVEHRPYEINGNIASRMPGYPVFVAAVYSIFGTSLTAVLIVQALLGGLTVRLVHAVAHRVSGSEPVALLSAGLAAADLLSVGFSAALLSETPFTLLLVTGLWLCLRLTRNNHLALWALLGLIWGLAVYFRASALWCLVPLVVWVAAMVGRERLGRALVGALVALAVMVAALSPWLIRNYARFGSGPLRLTTLEGISLYEAVYPQADGGPRQGFITVPPEMQPLNEAQRNDEWSRRAAAYILGDPLRIARLAWVKIGRTWSPAFNASEYHGATYQIAMLSWHIPLYIFGLLGLVAGRWSKGGRALLLVPLVYFTALHAIFLGSVRYRVPLMPMVCILAAMGALAIVGWISRSKRPGVATV